MHPHAHLPLTHAGSSSHRARAGGWGTKGVLMQGKGCSCISGFAVLPARHTRLAKLSHLLPPPPPFLLLLHLFARSPPHSCPSCPLLPQVAAALGSSPSQLTSAFLKDKEPGHLELQGATSRRLLPLRSLEGAVGAAEAMLFCCNVEPPLVEWTAAYAPVGNDDKECF